jgi:uncharacterized protein with PQ loop repeat
MAGSVSIQIADGGLLDLHSISVAAGYLGAALGVLMVVPQIVRTVRNPGLGGVSAASWGLTALACLAWMLYGLRADEIPQIPGNILLSGGAVIVALAVPSATSKCARAVRLSALALLITGIAVVAPPAAVGITGFGLALVSALPQTIESLTRPRQAASAVSVVGWLLRAAAQVCWLLYAVVRHDRTVTVSAVIILASSLLVVVIELCRPAAPAQPEAITADAVAAAES